MRYLTLIIAVLFVPWPGAAQSDICRDWAYLFETGRRFSDEERAARVKVCGRRTNWEALGRYGFSSLESALADRDLVVLKAMLEIGVPVDMRNRLGDTIAHSAMVSTYKLTNAERQTVLSWYASLGGDLNAVNNSNQTPLMVATAFENTSGMRRLIALGADPNFANKRGRTALFYTVSGGCYHKAGHMLLDTGARLDQLSGFNRQLFIDGLAIQCNSNAAERAFAKAVLRTAR